MENVICILGAVKEEIAGIKRSMTRREHTRLGRGDAWSGTWHNRPVVLVRTGVGRKAAREALARLLERWSPSLIISAGYTGAVVPSLKIGDLVVADRILEFQSDGTGAGQGRSSVKEYRLPGDQLDPVLALPRPEGFSISRGGLLTVDTVISQPAEKASLGDAYSVLGVDMETAALVAMAQEKEIPFLSIRAVSDTAGEELIDVSSFIEDGEVSKLKAGWYVVTHPTSLGQFNTMRHHARQATANLTRFLEGLIKSIPSPLS